MTKQVRTIIPLFLMVFITTSSVFFIIPELGPLILNHNQESIVPATMSDNYRHWLYSATLSFPQIFMLLGAPLWGALADRFGRKKTLIYALIGVVLSMMISVCGLQYHWVCWLLIGQALLGIMDASDTIAQAAAVDLSQGADKTKYISLISFGGTLGLIIGPLFGGVLSDNSLLSWFNNYTPFYAAIVLVTINIICMVLFYKDPYKNIIGNGVAKQEKILDFTFLMKTPIYKKLAIAFFIMEIGLALFYQSIPMVLLDYFHYSTYRIGLFFAFVSLVICLTYVILVPLFRRYFSKPTIITLAFLFISASMGMISHSELIVWISAVPVSIGVALIYCFTITLLSDETDDKNQGKIMGLSMSIVALSFLISDIIIGIFSTNHLDYIFIFITIISLIGFYFSNKILRKNQTQTLVLQNAD